MRKKLWMMLLLALSVCMLASCADLMRPVNEQNAINKLNALQADYESKGYEVTRADETAVAAFAESLASGEGLELKGAVAGLLEYSFVDPDTGKMLIGRAIAVTDNADAKAIEKLYKSYRKNTGDAEIKVTRKGKIVEVVYS